jgi:hypothetical protein
MLSLRCAVTEAFGSKRLAFRFGCADCCDLHETLLEECVACRCREQALEPELKGVAVAGVSQRALVGRAKKLIAQAEPAAELRRRLCCRSRPTLACEICVELRKLAVLSQGQQCDPRSFRYNQFKLAARRKPHERLADQRRIGCSIHELTRFRPPTRSRLGELMVRQGRATC